MALYGTTSFTRIDLIVSIAHQTTALPQKAIRFKLEVIGLFEALIVHHVQRLNLRYLRHVFRRDYRGPVVVDFAMLFNADCMHFSIIAALL
ncbi:hypothetical protein CDAR_395061 [Caerostris darwini]|uniref:Uncharacterized protein n=1 Tax=Caerostris darwini TaxID=1538125 RepID=A0AAV4TDZ5_9ARAC|nr:hypothetical protein CDAR_395061 [Caerostris darwini]